MNNSEQKQEKRTALLDKISALLAKTEQNGCTEAEAASAAGMAQTLMTKYGLSLSEIQAIESPENACDFDGTPIGDGRSHPVRKLAHAISFFTDTRTWYQSHGFVFAGKLNKDLKHHGMTLVYFGLPADVQVAIYLTNTLRVTLDTEWSDFWKAYPTRPKPNASTARSSFMRGMTSRLSRRLRQMKMEQSQADANDCRAIVLAKKHIVSSAFGASGIRIRLVQSGPSFSSGDETSLNAGFNAGSRVGISTRANHHIEA